MPDGSASLAKEVRPSPSLSTHPRRLLFTARNTLYHSKHETLNEKEMRIGDRFKAELGGLFDPVCGLLHDSSLDLERTAGAVRPAADVLGRTENDEASRKRKASEASNYANGNEENEAATTFTHTPHSRRGKLTRSYAGGYPRSYGEGGARTHIVVLLANCIS